MSYPQYLQDLIAYLSKWPSVGPKTAERYVFYLLKQNPTYLKTLAKILEDLTDNIKYCQYCRSLSSTDICQICQDKNRNNNILCIVENIQDLKSIEQTNQFKGYYFVLGELLNIINNIGPEKLPIKELKHIINYRQSKELLIALNFNLEGESTALYLKKIFPELNLSRLARGLPSGSDLEYADELTITNALKYKNKI